MSPLLSVLVLSVPTRVERFLPRIVRLLDEQMAEDDRAELLVLLDNKRRSVGEKWNTLMRAAAGLFVTCVGDDDTVADDYVARLLAAIAANPRADSIVFDTVMYEDGRHVADVRWGRYETPLDDWENKRLTRQTGELMAIRRDIRLRHPYPDVWRGSDWRMQRDLLKDIETEVRIEGPPLYHYWYRTDNGECAASQRRADGKRRVAR